jgi:hypothetical protein
MPIQTGANAKLYIATAKGSVLTTSGAYAALTWVECQQTDALGALGDTTAEVTFTGLGDARVQKLKGSSDAGNLELSMAFDYEALTASPTTGQYLLLQASNDTSSDNYRFKRVLGDRSTGSPLGTGTTEYCSGMVGSFVISVDNADSIVMLTSQVRVNSAIIRVAQS